MSLSSESNSGHFTAGFVATSAVIPICIFIVLLLFIFQVLASLDKEKRVQDEARKKIRKINAAKDNGHKTDEVTAKTSGQQNTRASITASGSSVTMKTKSKRSLAASSSGSFGRFHCRPICGCDCYFNIWLYGVYIGDIGCAVQCFLLHSSHLFPAWFCVAWLAPCVVTYAAAKSLLWMFFLQRAKAAQGIMPLLPKVVLDKLIPAYILFYFIVFLVLCPIFFRGAPSNPTDTVTACIFGEWLSWLFFVGAAVDMINTVGFLFLFIHPLWKLVSARRQQQQRSQNKSELERKRESKFIYIMKVNSIATSIGCSTSILIMVLCGLADTVIPEYLWLGANVDMAINAVCVFVMIPVNRTYVSQIWRCSCSAVAQSFSKKGGTEMAMANAVNARNANPKPKASAILENEQKQPNNDNENDDNVVVVETMNEH